MAGFTLTEIMVAAAVFMLVIAGVLSAHMFGLRMVQANEAKLTATQWSRKTFGKLTDEIRSSISTQVGNVSNGVFVALLDGQPQQGSGLLIYPTSSTNTFTIYFLNTSDFTFRRTTEQAGSTMILADSVTNNLIFSAQDLSGNVLTNRLNNPVVHLTLQFFQAERFLRDASVYKLETSVTRRTQQ